MFTLLTNITRVHTSLCKFRCSNFLRIQKMSSLKKFEDAKQRLTTLQKDPGNEIKLKIYGLFKQSTVGPCNISKPGAFDLVGKAKWEAWNSLGTMTKDDAMKAYVSLVNQLTQETPSLSSTTKSKYEGIIYSVDNNMTRITFNRPERKNAISLQMYQEIVDSLKEASENDTILTVITGAGDYYCSGNDLANFTSVEGDLSSAARNSANRLKSFVASFIDFPKPLIAAVNGPAIGIPVTLLGLFDAVYASEKATFNTPFSILGQTPEGCATYTFPKIMGYAKANELLLFNKKISAAEAKEVGLVTEVFPHNIFHEEVEKRLRAMSTASKNSMVYGKKLIRDVERQTLHKANAAECERLVERWLSPDCMQAIMDFFQNRGKAKL